MLCDGLEEIGVCGLMLWVAVVLQHVVVKG